MKQKQKNQVKCMAHIETPYHHMGVRVQTTSSSLTITVVETEKLGIEKNIFLGRVRFVSIRGFIFWGRHGKRKSANQNLVFCKVRLTPVELQHVHRVAPIW